MKNERLECDVLVVGSGAGGLAAAVTAANHGLSVIVAEKAAVLGGTTAFSGGWLWIPNAPHAERASETEPIEEPKRYLKGVMGEAYQESLLDTYLRFSPEMIAFFENNTQTTFIPGSGVPDFFEEIPGSRKGWRSVAAAPFDGRQLGDDIHLLRRAIPESTLWGMGIASGLDMRHFLEARKSPTSAWYVLKRLMKHGRDVLLYGRSMQLVNGNALVARLIASAKDYSVRFITSAEVVSLSKTDGRVSGAEISTPYGTIAVRAKKAVVLAAGGFPHDAKRQQQLFPHVYKHGTPHHSAAPRSNTGDGLCLGESVGGRVDTELASAAAWSPVSLVPRQDGRLGRFPHLVERGKPGIIAVLSTGKRFTNEVNPYHHFVSEWVAATPSEEPVRAWLICDHRFIRRYGLGAVKPFPFSLNPWLRNGYLKKGNRIADLAQQCGIHTETLEATVENYNRHAKHGTDPEFGRGYNQYQRVAGDASQTPNPCVAEMTTAPYYAVEIVPGSLGTFAGLETNEFAQVLDGSSQVIEGLYAVGNDMNSVMGGYYPSGGITLGPAMTFGYLAARKIAGACES